MLDLSILVEAARQLQPLPGSVRQLAGLVASEDWKLEDAEDVIKLDQALTLRLLRAANSAASGSRVSIDTVGMALLRMGVGIVLALAVGGNIRRVVQVGLPQYGLSEGELWRHSVASALAAEEIMRLGPHSVQPEAFTAALLHDVGKLVLAQFLDDQLLGAIDKARQHSDITTADAAEMDVLGTHHAELGGLVAEHWGLPGRLVNAIRYHHTPEKGDDVICDIVHVANQVAKRTGAGHVMPPEGDAIDADSQRRLGLTDALVDRATARVEAALAATVAQYEAA